jgi:colanic acid/amylovoran biosynthesis glycosyltransferase
MRIVEVIPSYPPEIFIARHILAMREIGIDPILVAQYEKSAAKPLDASVLNEYWDLGEVHVPTKSTNPLQKFFSLRHLLKPHTRIEGRLRVKVFSAYLESLKPDLVHFHMGTLAGHLYKIPQILHIPYTISLRGSDVQVKPYESQEKLLEGKLAIEGAAGVHTVSDALWEQAIETFELSTDNIFQKTIYTTVPLEIHKTIIESRKKKTFVAVGRFHWTRSYPMLLLAFQKYCLASPDSELLLIGDGELRECINYWIRYLQLENNVHLLGKLNYSGIAEVILQADAFIQSSIAEGFSNATAEAMALGCPVFATDVGGTNELIKDGENGFLLDPVSPDSWLKKFQLVNDELLMRSIGENARKTAVDKFSSTIHAEEFTKFFRNAIENAK